MHTCLKCSYGACDECRQRRSLQNHSHDEQDELEFRLGDRQATLEMCRPQVGVFQGKMVVLQEIMPHDQPEMKMNVDDGPRFGIAAVMMLDMRVPARGPRDGLDKSKGLYGFPELSLTVLGDQQIQVRLTRQDLLDNRIAFPVTIADMILFEGGQQAFHKAHGHPDSSAFSLDHLNGHACVSTDSTCAFLDSQTNIIIYSGICCHWVSHSVQSA